MKLWRHQQVALEKYRDREYFGLLFPCGMGKTLATIAIAEAKDRPVLIIAPNALCSQWEQELRDKGDKKWDTLVCTSKTSKTKKFRERFKDFCKEENEGF